jgi:hypothetical protein
MNMEPPPLPPQAPKKPIALPLVLAFVPSAIVLLLLTFKPSMNHMVACCVPAALVSTACLVISSVMLIKRNTSAAIVFGVLLGMLNLVISGGLGCAALLSDFNGH